MTLPSVSVETTLRADVYLGGWRGQRESLRTGTAALAEMLAQVDRPVYVVGSASGVAYADSGEAALGGSNPGTSPLLGFAAPCLPEALGDPAFRADHGLRYNYMAGAMANGIASEGHVEAMARAGMLGVFGAAGLAPERVALALDRLHAALGPVPYAFNLIHSPNESHLEDAIVDLYLARGLRLVEASAFMQITPVIVRYRLHGIHRDARGVVVTPNRVIAKLSREELAEKFFSPAPEKILRGLLEAGKITAEQAELAASIPIAQDVTAEADSGGHTDHRPAIALLPALCSLRDRMQAQFGYAQRLRVGLGGGIATPESIAAAFAMGAAYVVTGSINQACIESGSSDTVRAMLAEARQADVARAPAADMFEMGVTVQVLKRGTMFPMRAAKLYELYRTCDSMDAIPAAEREKLEKNVFRFPLDEVWRQTREFFAERDPRQIERAEKNPKHKMALVFRWYLGQSSNWANRGVADRVMDYQIWCGPAMGAFNEWAQGTYLETPARRRVADVGRTLLHGAAVVHRANTLRATGVEIMPECARLRPVAPEDSTHYFANGASIAANNGGTQ